MANELINITREISNSIKDPQAFVDSMSLEQCTQLLTILKLWSRDTKKDKEAGRTNFIKALENKVYKSTLNEWNVAFLDGSVWESKVVRAKDTIKIEKKVTTDYEAAIKFAKENNLHLPMTERIVIEPQVDTSKIEMEDWFQENADKFIHVDYIEKQTNGSNNIRNKQIKEAL